MSGQRKFGVSYGYLSNKIHVGRVNKTQNAFLDGKEDCTLEALFAVAEYVLTVAQGEDAVTDGRRRFVITVTEVTA